MRGERLKNMLTAGTAAAVTLTGGCASHYPAPGPVRLETPARPMTAKHPLPVRVVAAQPYGVGKLTQTGEEARQSAGQALVGLLGDVDHFLYIADENDRTRYPYQLVVSVEFLDAQTEGRPVKRMGFDVENPEQRSSSSSSSRRSSRDKKETGGTQDARYNFVSCRVLLMLQEDMGAGVPPRVVVTGRGQANWKPGREFILFGPRVGTTTTPVIYHTIEQAVAFALRDILSGEKLAQVDATVSLASMGQEREENRRRLTGVMEAPAAADRDTP